MSVTIGRTWRDAQRARNGAMVPARWQVQVYFKFDDGTVVRERTIVGEGTAIPIRSERFAKEWGEKHERELFAKGPPTKEEKLASSETVSAYYKRYYDAAALGQIGRKNRGKPQASIGDRRTRFRLYIEQEIGGLPMRAVTPNHLRAIVEKLDDKIRIRIAFYAEDGDEQEREGLKPGLAAKTAAHIWSEITSGFKEAFSSKRADLRIEDLILPTFGVQPPLRTDQRIQAALYPSEVTTLLAHEGVLMWRRRLYALAIYTGARLSELSRITAAHIDFEHGMIEILGSKTAVATRRVPIEPALRPLLKLLWDERKTGPLVDAPRSDGGSGASALINEDLAKANVTRADLSRDDEQHMPFTFHGCRHTAVTHAYVAGRDETWLRIVYGHVGSEMTRRYLDAMALTRSTFGTPFPPLPPSILGGAKILTLRTSIEKEKSA
jgi:integrase